MKAGWTQCIAIAALGLGLFPVSSRSADVPKESLAALVPADVGLFVEASDAGDLLVALTEPEIWLGLAELAGQPAPSAELELWRANIRLAIGMNPRQAIRALFSDRVAYLGNGVGRSQNAAVICVPRSDPAKLAEQWGAQRQPYAGRPALYQLQSGAGLAVSDKHMFFGDLQDHGIWEELLAQLDAPKPEETLARDEVFRALYKHVPPDPEVVLFARLGKASPTIRATSRPTSRPTTQRVSRPRAFPLLPGALQSSQNILVSLHEESDGVHFRFVGDTPSAAKPSKRAPLANLVGTLPSETLVAWGGYTDFSALAEQTARLPSRNILRVLLQADRAGDLQGLTEALDQRTVVALGTVQVARQWPDAPAVPAAALLLGIHPDHAEAAQDEFDRMFEVSTSLYNLLALGNDWPTVESTAIEFDGSRRGSFVDLSRTLGEAPEKSLLGELHLCGIVDGDALIIATHREWLAQILAARAKPGAARRAFRMGRPPDSCGTLVTADTARLGRLSRSWLDFLKTVAPAVLDQNWWRPYQPGGRSVRLGVTVSRVEGKSAVRVESVLPNGLSDGVIEAGDIIVGCNDRRFSSDDPVSEFRDAIQQRPYAQRLDVLVEPKAAPTRRKRVPIPFVDPIQMLRRVTAIGRLAGKVLFFDQQRSNVPQAYLLVELPRRSRQRDPGPALIAPTTASQPAKP